MLTPAALSASSERSGVLVPFRRSTASRGFTLERLDTFYMRGPKTLGHMFEGVATK
jgi:hypothetical protein